MASERAGMAVNKRGLTLRELLQQTVHYNPKVRRGELPITLYTGALGRPIHCVHCSSLAICFLLLL